MSGTPEVINIASTSNVNRSGVWVFKLNLEKDLEEEPVVTDQLEESMVSLNMVSLVELIVM